MNNKIIYFYLSFFISFSSLLAQEGIVLDPKMEPNQQRSEEVFLDSNSFFRSSFFGSIGYVSAGCIGTVVAPRVILTVANCVMDGNGTKLPSLDHVWIKGQNVGIEKVFVKKGFNKNLNDNWAFILLDDNNFTNNNLNPMVAASIDFNDPNHQFPDYVQALGYDFRNRAFSYQKFCSLYKDQKNMLKTNCLSTTGINGSPLLISDESGRNATVVAMLSYYMDARSKIQYVVGLDKDFFSNFEKIYEESLTDEESPFIRIDLKPKPQEQEYNVAVSEEKNSILEDSNKKQVVDGSVQDKNKDEDIFKGVLDDDGNNGDATGSDSSSNNANNTDDQNLVELVPPGTIVNEDAVNDSTDDLIDLPDAYPEDVEDGIIVSDDVVPDGATPIEPPTWSDPSENTVEDNNNTVTETVPFEEEVITPNEDGSVVSENPVPLTPPEWVDPNESTNTENVVPPSNGTILPGRPLSKGQKPLDLPPPPQQTNTTTVPNSGSNPLEGVIVEENYTTPTAPVTTPVAPSTAALPSDPFYYRYNQGNMNSSSSELPSSYNHPAIPLTVPNAERINAMYGLPSPVDPRTLDQIPVEEKMRLSHIRDNLKVYWLNYLNDTMRRNNMIIQQIDKMAKWMIPYDGNLTQQMVIRNVETTLYELRQQLQKPNRLKDMDNYIRQLSVDVAYFHMEVEAHRFVASLNRTHAEFNKMANMVMATDTHYTYIQVLNQMFKFRVELQASLNNLKVLYQDLLVKAENRGHASFIRSSIILSCLISYMDALVKLSFN